MHNLIPYSGDVFALYKEAVDRKKNGEVKERLVKAKNVIQAYYAEFDKHFSARTLRSIASGRVAAPLSGDLYDMYGFEAAIVKKVKTWLKANNPVTVYGICQFCGLKQFDTMDHILPHKQYVEYSVHARNLIPCCADCNRTKNEREVLNLYQDTLPSVEYLIMDVVPNGDTIDFRFHLDNSKNLVPAELYAKICDHFDKLDLCAKMRTQATTQLARVVVQINTQYVRYGKDAVVEAVNEELDGLRTAYGYNSWEVAFKKGLINSPVFWEYYSKGLLR